MCTFWIWEDLKRFDTDVILSTREWHIYSMMMISVAYEEEEEEEKKERW